MRADPPRGPRRRRCCSSRPRATPTDRVRGLEAGGDDYLAKPFHLRELLLRVAAILRRSSGTSERRATLAFGGNDRFPDLRSARVGRRRARAHAEGSDDPEGAGRARGQIVTREEILDRVWGYEVFPSTRTIDNFIVRLRKRFERNPEAPAHFHTVRGVGYRFTREPQPTEARANEAAHATTAAASDAPRARAAPAALDHAPGRPLSARVPRVPRAAQLQGRSRATPRSRPKSR